MSLNCICSVLLVASLQCLSLLSICCRLSPKSASATDMGENGTPLQIVSVNKEGLSLKVDELDKILQRDDVKKTPVAVLSISGACLTGKSFLLNFLRRYLNRKHRGVWIGSDQEPLSGFEWKQGSDGVTKGILMWSKPFMVNLEGGGKVALLLVDTQGFYGKGQHQPYDAAMFALSLLLSSTQVYNLIRTIERPLIAQLEDALEIAYKTLLLVENRSMPEKCFQRLYCLVRDWLVSEGNGFGKDAGMKYLEEQLKEEKWMQHFSEKLECFLMPFPGQNAAEYKASDEPTELPKFQGQPAMLEERFKRKLTELVKDLLDEKRLLVKRINGSEVTGADLASHFKKWKKLFDSVSSRQKKSENKAFIEVFREEYKERTSKPCNLL